MHDTGPRAAIRLNDVGQPVTVKPGISKRLYVSTVIFGLTVIALQFAAIIALLALAFRTPTPTIHNAGVVQRSIMTVTPTSTATPEPTTTATPAVMPTYIITTTLFGWYDSPPDEASFISNDVVAGQTYALCWAGQYINGNKIDLPIQQINLYQTTGQSGACVLAKAKPNDKPYKLGFISQAVRQTFIGPRTTWPILKLTIYKLPGNLPFPTLMPAKE
jgi:hypothetical protein